MKSLCPFFVKFSSLISWSLSCFDRVIFKGHLPIGRLQDLHRFVDYTLGIRRTDFIRDHLKKWSDRLVKYAMGYAEKCGVRYEYHPGEIDKDAWAKEQIKKNNVTEGLVGILCVQEMCSTFRLASGEGRPVFAYDKKPVRVLYYYFLDRQLGLIHVRLQTWAPFPCQVYVNGHEYVARELQKKGVKFDQIDNVIVRTDDAELTQKIADKFCELNWPKILEAYARRVNPLLKDELKEMSHYWVTDQAEFATDIVFRSKEMLSSVFRALVAFAFLTFSPLKVFQFLGRRYHERFDGEVQTHYKTVRDLGCCVKHYMRKNWLKMYDKLGLVLRIETVINQPKEFKVYRECRHRDGSTSMGWYRMCKGVGNLRHYQRHALLCNLRYLEALSEVGCPDCTYTELQVLTESYRDRESERSYAGFNPAREEEVKIFSAVLSGDGIAQGFRNEDIRRFIGMKPKNEKEGRRQSAAIGRVLKRLHVRKLIAKVPHTRRWRVTETGRRILSDTLRAYRRYTAA